MQPEMLQTFVFLGAQKNTSGSYHGNFLTRIDWALIQMGSHQIFKLARL